MPRSLRSSTKKARSFNFKKVLLLNPSVNLYNSISKLDRFLENIPGGVDNFNKMFKQHRQSDRRRLQKIHDRVVFAGPRVRCVQRQSAARRRAGGAHRYFVPAVVLGAGIHIGRDDELRLHQTGEPDPDAQHRNSMITRRSVCASDSPTISTNTRGRTSRKRRPRRRAPSSRSCRV